MNVMVMQTTLPFMDKLHILHFEHFIAYLIRGAREIFL